MAGFVREQVGIRQVGTHANVANHPKARLMYYLGCVKTVLHLDDNISHLTNEHNYQYLSEDDTDTLLRLVVLFSPDELIGKIFFHSDELCDSGYNNEFYELSAVSHLFAVTNSVLIGGQRKRVAKIMVFKIAWLHKNYLTPIRSYQYRLSRLARGLPGYEPPRNSSSTSQSCNIL